MTELATSGDVTDVPRGHLPVVSVSSGAGVLVRRINLLLISLVLGAALVVFAVLNYADALRASDSFAEKQGFGLYRTLGIEPGRPPAVLRERFERVLATRAVTYLGFWRGQSLEFEFGDDVFAGLLPTPGEIQMRDGRARMSFSNRMFAPVEQPRRGAQASSAGAPPQNVVVMEFEPVGATDFAQRALVSLWLSCGAALLLTSAAVVVWRLGERGERMQIELGQQRHLARLGSLSAVLAHELRNPLTALKGNAQLLSENATTERARAQSVRVVDSVLRLEAVIDDLLEFSRSGAIHLIPSSPWHVLRAAIDATHPERIDCAALDAPSSWLLDASRIQQVLVNLLENASQVTPAEQRISATVTQEGGDLVYIVKDEGPGVMTAERARIFEPFYTTRLHGTGLGLAIAKRIVELHGGCIDVENASGGGALFRIRLPPVRGRTLAFE
jgi:signal transduction histidine kinase